MKHTINRLLHLQTRDGQTLVEFTLLFSLVVLVAITILIGVRDRMSGSRQVIAQVSWTR